MQPKQRAILLRGVRTFLAAALGGYLGFLVGDVSEVATIVPEQLNSGLVPILTTIAVLVDKNVREKLKG